MKKIIIYSTSTPTNPKIGFGDELAVEDPNTGVHLFSCSACPNPDTDYGWLDTFSTYYECVDHKKFGKCLLLHGGAPLPSRIANPIHRGEKILTEVFVHEANIGYLNPDWRGSRGCITMRRTVFPDFIRLFSVGEKGVIVLVKQKRPSPYEETRPETKPKGEVEMEEKSVLEKSVFASKTLWLNALAVIIEVVQLATDQKIIPTGYSTLIVAMLNIVLRTMTRKGLSLK